MDHGKVKSVDKPYAMRFLGLATFPSFVTVGNPHGAHPWAPEPDNSYPRTLLPFTRHANFPTTDIPVEELPAAKAWFSRAIEERVFPFMAACYPDLIQGIEAL